MKAKKKVKPRKICPTKDVVGTSDSSSDALPDDDSVQLSSCTPPSADTPPQFIHPNFKPFIKNQSGSDDNDIVRVSKQKGI